MKDLSKQKFEEEWRRAFEESELPPANDVWARLDAHLANQETRKYKNRLVWFQRIAAGVLLLLLAGGTWLWLNTGTPSPGLANAQGEAVSSGQEMARNNGVSPAAAENAPGTNVAAARAEKEQTFSGREAQRSVESAPVATDLAQARTSVTPTPVDGAGETGLTTNATPSVALSRSPKSSKAGADRIADAAPRPKKNASPVQQPLRQPGADLAREALGTITVLPPSEAVVKEAGPADPAAGRMALNELSSRTLHAQEPVIRPRSILPHLSEAYWAKVLATEEQEAKEEQAEKAKRDRWQVGLAFAPGTYQPNFRVNEGSPAFANAVGNIAPSFNSARTDLSALSAANRDLESASAAGLSYQTGLRMEYAITRRFSVQSGVDYLYNSSSVNTYSYVQNFFNGRNEPVFASILNYGNQTRAELMAADAFAPSAPPGSVYADVSNKNLSQSSSAISVRNVYEYVGIPVRVNYQLLDKDFGITLGAGVSGDIFLNNRFGNETEGIDEVNIASTEGTAYRKLGISAWLGLKMQYRFAGKYSVFLEPSYRAAVTSFTNTEALQSHPSLFGVGTGLQMRF